MVSISLRTVFNINSIINFQGWCAVNTDEALKTQILTNTHSPQAFRTIGPLSNNEDFAKDFNCRKGSKMNPEKKCTVW